MDTYIWLQCARDIASAGKFRMPLGWWLPGQFGSAATFLCFRIKPTKNSSTDVYKEWDIKLLGRYIMIKGGDTLYMPEPDLETYSRGYRRRPLYKSAKSHISTLLAAI